MKQFTRLFLVAIIAGAVTLGGYKLFVESNEVAFTPEEQSNTSFIPTNLSTPTVGGTNVDFTQAAEKTVNAVVHVKNTTVSRQGGNIFDYFYGRGEPRAMIGTGSGVVISPDGYIVTNNHVIENASQLEVTLNDNRTYEANVIGTDPKTDIALIKVNAPEDLAYVTFGDSNALQIGEWVLAVGNPFNLTSTVTAGIVSAKARDLNEFDGNPQSFIQTDAAVNRGNSGGALVNIRGELVGINTAITSETGSYVGYSFAVPSNNARKVIEDIMEYGNVQRGILGINGGTLDSRVADQLGISEIGGVYVSGVEKESGAYKSGIREGDIIKQLDGYNVGKFSDLTGYLGSKRPNDVVDVTVLRDGRQRTIPVTLIKLETFQVQDLGLEVRNISTSRLRERGAENGVEVTRSLTQDMAQYDLRGIIITEINNERITNIDDVRDVMNRRKNSDPIKMTFLDTDGEMNTFIFR